MDNFLIHKIAGNRFTPCGLADKLKASVILESSSFLKGRERYSILMTKEAFRIIQKDSGELFFQDSESNKRVKSKSKDILDLSNYFGNQFTNPPIDHPFPVGGMGYLGYEFAAHCDKVHFRSKTDEVDIPESILLFGSSFVLFDHYTDELYLLAISYKEKPIDLIKTIELMEKRINDMDFNYMNPDKESYPIEYIPDKDEKNAFLDGVKVIKENIVKGNIIQAVISRQLAIKTEMPAITAYKNLRSCNPSPYMFYLDFGDFQLFGASPEVQVKTDGTKAEIRPIAGTRRRGQDKDEDDKLKEELLADPKEKAEHLMLVDLARNDIGRVCKPGTIQVEDFMTVEFYSHVMHIVSKVTGTLNEGILGTDLLRATFPAGTVSGAPKIMAMKIIDSLEIKKRGFYAGIVGYFGPNGKLDTCITIRSAIKKEGIIYMRAGAGIVKDSTPEREYMETEEKLRALAVAVGMEI